VILIEPEATASYNQRREGNMTKAEYKQAEAAVKNQQREVAKSPERARELLVKAGIITIKGNTRKPYK
jgi:hypothetical protein